MTGSPPGEAVGGLVSCVLSEGGEGVEKGALQLQRIASRCHCQVFYVTYGEVVEESVPRNPGSVSLCVCVYTCKYVYLYVVKV